MNKEQGKALWEKDLSAGYSPQEAKARLGHFAQTGIALPDPTEKYWAPLIGQESGGKQSAVSPVGATGIAQVMPATGPEAAKLAGLEWDPIAFKQDPVYNAKLGRAYLRKQMADNGNDPVKALASYNAGPGAVRKAGGDLSKLPAETQNYVPSIMNKADQAQQPDLDNPDDIAQAREALMTPRDQAKAAYEKVLASGGTPEQAKAAITQFLPSKAAPVAQGPAQAAPQPAPQQPAQPQEPTFAQGVQNDIEKIYPTDPVVAGTGRSLMGMVQGTRKLYNQATGDTAKVKELEADEQRARDFWQSVDPKGSGFSKSDLGRIVGDSSGSAAISKALPLAGIVGGLVNGGVQGAIQPTTANDSQALNAGTGATIGGILSGLGKGITSVLGREDPTRQAAAGQLRAQGVDVPPGQEYNSPMGAALRKMGGEKGSNPIPEQSLTGTLANKLGMQGADITNSTLEANLRRAGQAIGDAHSDSVAIPQRDFFDKLLDIGQKYMMSGPVAKGDSTMSMIDHVIKLARPGTRIPGEQYQALRTGLTADSVKGSAADKEAMGGMKRALDDMFNAQNPKPELSGLRSEYRLSKILRAGSGIPADGMTARQLRNRVEGAAGKGEVNGDVRDLLNQTNQILPKVKIGGDAAAGAGDDVAIKGLDRPGLISGLMALTRGVAGPASKAYDKGTIQKLINDPVVRGSLANLLRGGVIPQATQIEQGAP